MSENKPPDQNPTPAPASLTASPMPVSPALANKEASITLDTLLLNKAPDVFNVIPEEKKARLAKVSIEQFSYRSSMLPEPSELEAYNRIIPNGADRIMKMVESQTSHRLEIENKVIGSQQKHEGRGQWFGFIIAITFGAFALYAALQGQTGFAISLGSTTLLSLVGTFVYSRRRAQKNLDDKSQTMQLPTPPSNKDAQVNPNSRKNRKKRR